jgi:hypothetical protein
VRLGLAPGGTRGLGHCHKGVAGVQGAGGRGAVTGKPPQMGTSGSAQRRGFRRSGWGAGCVGGRGGVLVPQVARSAVTRPPAQGGSAGAVDTAWMRKRPGSTLNPKFLSEIVLDARSSTFGWTGHKPGSGFSDLAPSILHYNWF